MNTKELIINQLQHLAVEKGLDMYNCKDIAEVYEKYFTQLQNTSSNSDYAKCLTVVGDELKTIGFEGVDSFIDKIKLKHFA